MGEVMSEVKLNKQTTSQLPYLYWLQNLGYTYLPSQKVIQLHYLGMSKEIIKHTANMIDFVYESCYNTFTLPPIFRDGARGGLAASAFNAGRA